MKRVAAAVAALMILAACGDDETPTTPSSTGPITLTAQLSAANEVPPVTNVDANGRGAATITLTVTRNTAGTITGGGSASFTVQVIGFPPGTVVRGAHIHNAPAGQNPAPAQGGTVFLDTGLAATTAITLTDGTGTLTFVNSAVTQDQATRIVAAPANFFVDLHTAANPDGAIRGQLARQ